MQMNGGIKKEKWGESDKICKFFRYTLHEAMKQHFNLLIFHYALFPDGVEENENVLSLFIRAEKLSARTTTENRHCIISIGLKRDHVERTSMAGERDKNSREIENFLHIKIQSSSDIADEKTGII